MPNIDDSVSISSDFYKYNVEVKLDKNSPQTVKSIQEAGLRNLRSTFLSGIERNETFISAVSPDSILQDNDILIFVGDTEGAKELRNIKGLEPAGEHIKKLRINSSSRQLVEAVISPNFPYLNLTVKESSFRNNYKAVFLSLYRDGERILGKIGDIVFKVGDTILLDTDKSFVE